MLKLFQSRRPTNSQRSKVIFLHVPKTGGTTFSRVLQRLYRDSYTFFDDDAVDVFVRNLEAYACTEVHATLRADRLVWGTKNIMKEPNWRLLSGAEVFVMFRDPVEHYISSFYQARKFGKTLESTAAWKRFFPDTLDEYLENPRFSNLQLKFLLGIAPEDHSGLTDADLQHAKRLISTLGINVGILERYSESLHLFEYVTGSKIPLRIVVVRNKNRTPHAQRRVDDATRQRIRDLNALDQELYDFAEKLFDEQIAGCGPSPRYRYLSEESLVGRVASRFGKCKFTNREDISPS
ncbi:sulfotransferase family protein [Rhodopirellula sp.]|nr:sulfotransferase family protein [Rhodopirellula sp.]